MPDIEIISSLVERMLYDDYRHSDMQCGSYTFNSSLIILIR
jgi:hypothetical protein